MHWSIENDKEKQAITRAIVNCRFSAYFKVLTLIKVRYNLIKMHFEIGN